MASQRDIAERAGVSVMTVSRVLRGERYVRPALAEAVRKVAAELNYRPNPLVQSLMVSRGRRTSAATGLVVAWIGRGGPVWRKSIKKPAGAHPFARYFEGAKKELDKRGFRLHDFSQDESGVPDPRRMERILRARGVPGVLLGPAERGTVMPLQSVDGLTLVQVGRSRQHPLIDRVAADPIYAMQLCLRKLAEAGYSRIGYFDALDHNLRSERRWEAAFLLEREGCPALPPCLIRREREFHKTALRQYATAQRLDALISGRGIVGKWMLGDPILRNKAFACLNLHEEDGGYGCGNGV
ncbi:MAG: LacI family DNA-binding transcriptional regulator [Opitutales bacterium]|nr:LacI family DNA-binding transcriptional regulator [Opitutales bacterium]